MCEHLLSTKIIARRAFVRQGRVYLYTLLRDLLLEPMDQNLFERLSKDQYLVELSEFSEGAKQIVEFLKEQVDSDRNDRLKQAEEEYMRLFVGPGHVKAPIWESVYFDREGLLFGENTLQVRAFYEKHGLEFQFKNQQPEDHMAVELDFMLFLLQKESESKCNCDLLSVIKEQKEFLQNHILAWYHLFAEKIIKHSHSKLYVGIAYLLVEAVQMDVETLIEKEGELINVK